MTNVHFWVNYSLNIPIYTCHVNVQTVAQQNHNIYFCTLLQKFSLPQNAKLMPPATK